MRRSFAPSRMSLTLNQQGSVENRDPNTLYKAPTCTSLARKRCSQAKVFPNKRVCYKRLLEEIDSDGEGEGEGEGGNKIKSLGQKTSFNHEQFILQILNKPFKVPMEGYVSSSSSSRCLGMRRSGLRVALHDPYSDGALVLFYPLDQSAQEQLVMSKDDSKKQVWCVQHSFFYVYYSCSNCRTVGARGGRSHPVSGAETSSAGRCQVLVRVRHRK